ncbi:NACHT domain-containing protein [Aromatoleum sp.]|uniref:NACHT domain-containing protein n=1 Tax=Aromatoleum sp. TaxID=2307007 RepID=UPI002FC9CB68
MNRETIINDFAPFVDLGEGLPKVSEQGEKLVAKFTRDGRPLKIVLDKTNGKITTIWGATTKHFSSVAAMLSSEIFANLRRWADAQTELLGKGTAQESALIPLNGITHRKVRINSVDDVDSLLGSTERKPDATEVLLIDGPAGIGKTRLIEQIAFKRSSAYKNSFQPLLLHVKSRGRVLSNIQDLMAFSLQTIRSTITYDQLPILARYGVVLIAIDGFDELGDPNGYELAWAQVGQLITSIRGNGTLILAGRDTFIGRSRLLADVPALRAHTDIVSGVTLESPTPEQAKDWLKRYNWTDANFELPSISVLLEPDSFALRPVFLKLLSEIKPKQLKEKHERYLTPFLVDHITDREARLFGRPVEAVMSFDEIRRFINNFMLEVAREMAESQTEALEAIALMWIAEASLGDGYPPEIVSLVKNRASVVAFLMNDERQGYRSFIHTHLLNYFLSHVTIHAIVQGEVPKFVRRNLFGTEFLSVFVDVLSETASENRTLVDRFIDRLLVLPHTYTSVDRTIRNAGALVLASLANIQSKADIRVADFEIDDAVVTGTAASVQLNNVVVNQLNCRSADLSQVVFSECQVFTLLASDSSRFSASFPTPSVLVLDSGEQVLDAETITKWLEARGRNVNLTVSTGVSSSKLRAHPIYILLGQGCRIRQYWLRAEDDLYGKILKDRYWSVLSTLLREEGFLREEYRQASGKSSNFVHIKHKNRLLAEDPNDIMIVRFFQKLEELAT